MNPPAFEALLRRLLVDLEARRFKLPRDVAPGEWLAEQVLHWMAEEVAPRLRGAGERAARLREGLRGLEGAEADRKRSLEEAAESLARDCRELEALLVPPAPPPAAPESDGPASEPPAGSPGDPPPPAPTEPER